MLTKRTKKQKKSQVLRSLHFQPFRLILGLENAIRAFLAGTVEMSFEVRDRCELYRWVDQTERRQKYGELKRQGRGLPRHSLAKPR